jgi:hypothetical protein
MANSINLITREVIVRLYGEGVSMLQISLQEKVSYDSVKRLIRRHKAEGAEGLLPRYSHCGRKRVYESECSYRLVRLYKHYHPQWGVGYILMKIGDKYPHLPLCVGRVYERRLKLENQLKWAKNPPLQYAYQIEQSRLPHDAWQVDAKELLRTLDGQTACYLSVSDEKTGCLLAAKVFSLWQYESGSFRISPPIFIAPIQRMGAAQSF